MDPAIGLPPRPVLIDLTDEAAWDQTPLVVQDAYDLNQAALKEYAALLESRIRRHDEKP